jgi:hypothetical protein
MIYNIFLKKALVLLLLVVAIPTLSNAAPRPGDPIFDPLFANRCFRLGLNEIPVYYSRNPQSISNPNYATREKLCILTFANKIEQFTFAINNLMRSSNGVINSSLGNYTPITLETSAMSTCPTTPSYGYNLNKDFALRFDSEGSLVRAGVKLCRNYSITSTDDTLRIIAVLINTIQAYYPNSHVISSYTILDKYNNCINGTSGVNSCKPYSSYIII